MADNLYQFTGKVKLCQVFPGFFSRDFFFCFCWKNLPSFGLAKKKVFGSTLLSRNSPEKGRFLLIIIFARQSCSSSACSRLYLCFAFSLLFIIYSFIIKKTFILTTRFLHFWCIYYNHRKQLLNKMPQVIWNKLFHNTCREP